MKKILYQINHLKKIANSINNNLKKVDILLLNGELGTGKTQLIKYILESLGIKKEMVTSPSFNLVNQYYLKKFTIWHYDLYKIKNYTKFTDLNLENFFKNAIIFIEWGEVIKLLLPSYHIELEFIHTKKYITRKIIFYKNEKFYLYK